MGNAISSSGATTSTVTGESRAQPMRDSVPFYTCRPTVSGRASTELVVMSGHRKLFQCVLTETRPNATMVGLASGT